MILGTLTWKTVEKNQFSALEIENQETVTKKIQEATFVINNPLPEISLDLVKTPSKKYHLIAGSFAEKSNANRKVKQLLKKGFRAKIINTNKWGLEQVGLWKLQYSIRSNREFKTNQSNTSKRRLVVDKIASEKLLSLSSLSLTLLYKGFDRLNTGRFIF